MNIRKNIAVAALAFLIVGGLYHTGSSQTADTLTNGLVGYWKFDSLDTGALTTPDSSGQNNFARVGMSTSLTSGKFGSAIRLNSTSAGQFIAIEKSFGSNTWAVSSWVNPDLPIPATNPQFGLLTILSGDNGTQLIGIQKDGVYMYTTKLADFDFAGKSGWHHVAVSYDGSGYTVAVDGAVQAPVAQPNVVSANVKRYIGVKSSVANNNPFKGLIDETRLYNRALTSSEVTALYKNVANAATAPAAAQAPAAAAAPAVVLRPSNIVFSPKNTSPKDLFTNIQNEIDSRIGSLAANDTTKNLWALPRGNGSGGWRKSSTVWTGNLDWSGISPWNNDFNTNINGYYKAGTLVSPRHIIFANHFRIAASSTIIFIDRNGDIVTRKIGGFRTITGTDISVAALDSDVPETVSFYPVFKKKDLETYLKDSSTDTSLNLPFILFDRDDHIVVRSTNKNRFFDPVVANINHDISPSGKRAEFNEDLVLGDSGNPAFVLVGGQPVLIFTNFDYKASPSISHYFDQINTAMTSLGGGYQLSTIDLSGFTKPTINNTPAPIPAAPADGILGYWKLDTTANGVGVTVKPGKFGNALYFDNTNSAQYVTISDPIALPQWTLSAWVNPDMPIPPATAPFYSSYTLLSGDTDILPITIRNDGVYLFERPITGYKFSLNPGWHHVAVRYDGTNISATVDGGITGTRSDTNPLGLAVRKRAIGTASPFSTNVTIQNKFGFKGMIDEVRLYNKVVSDREIANLFGANAYPALPQTTVPTTKIATDAVLTTDKTTYKLGETIKMKAVFTVDPAWISWMRNSNQQGGNAVFTLRDTTNKALIKSTQTINIITDQQTVSYDWLIPDNPVLANKNYVLEISLSDSRNAGTFTKTITSIKTDPTTIGTIVDSQSLDLENGLFGYWKFDSISNGTTPDSSKNNNPGVLVASPTIDTGKFDKSLVFGSNNTLNYVETTKGFGSTQWAVSLWVKPETPVPTFAPFNALLTFLSLDRDLDQNRARMLDIMKDGVYLYTTKILDYNFNANPGWHHVVVNYDGSKITAVVDNDKKNSIDLPNNPMLDSSTSRRIGLPKEGGVHGFKGNIDEVRLYSRALSLREIGTLFDSNVANIPVSALIATKTYPPATLPAWTRYTNIQIDLNRPGWCKAATTPGVAYDAMPLKFNDSAGINLHYSIFSVKPGNSYTYYVQCIDKIGNKIAQEIPVTFSVQSDTTAPSIIEVSHSAVRDTTAEIVWSTEEKSDSKVEYWERGTSARTTLTDQAQGYPHAMLLTSLKPATTYDYIVSSTDSSGNRSSSSQRSFTTRTNPARTYYVAPDGDDTNNGLDIKNAFKTLEKARDIIRTIRPLPAGGIQVLIKGGVYARTAPFVLTAADSGTAEAPIRYRALDTTPVRINGGQLVTGFTANTNPRIKTPNVLQVNLKNLGITDFGTRSNSGAFIRTGNSPVSLFFKDEPMILARYPDKTNGIVSQAREWLSIVSTDGRQTFSTTDLRPATWASFSNIWVQGNWYFNHRHTTLAVTNVVRNGSQFTITAPGDPTGMKVNRPFFYMNVPEELDQPGEYYVDTATGMLYFYPPTSISSSQVYVSIANELLDMNGVKHTTFTGITFENARGKAIDMDQDSEFNMIENSIVRNASVGISIAGKQNGIWGSKIYNTEDNGVVLYGGKDKTLEGGYNYVVNNEIFNVATLNKSYRAAINMSGTDIVIPRAGPSVGVANRARYNYIHDTPHYGVVAYGNNHLIDSNRIEKACEETIDCGAIYIYTAQLQKRGTLVKYNDISNVYGFDFENKYDLNAVGIYTDNAQSGTTIYGNVLHDLDTGILQNLGRDNVIENNVITGTNEPLHVNAVGMNLNGKQYPIQIAEVSNTTPVVITTVRPHNNLNVYDPSPDKTVTIKGVLGATGINGTWTYEIVDDYRLKLIGTKPGLGEYAGGGILIQDTTIPDSFTEFAVDKQPYSRFYPELASMLDEPDYAEPLGTYYIKNAIYGNKVTNIENARVGSGNKTSYTWLVNEKNIKFDPSNVTTVPFTLGNYSALYSAGLASVPVNQIGLIKGDTLTPVVILDPPVNQTPTTKLTSDLTITTDKTAYTAGDTVKMTITFKLDPAWVTYLKTKGQTEGEMSFNANAPSSVMQKTFKFNLVTSTINQTYDWVIAPDSSAADKTHVITAEVYDADRTIKETKAAPSITIAKIVKVNTAPVAQDATFTIVSPGTGASVVLNATDAQNDTLIYTPASLTTQKGTLVKTGEGKYTYTLKTPLPTASFKETFTYTASDGKLTSAPGTITIEYTLIAPTKFTLTLSKTGNGTLTATGISCGMDCQGDFTKDSMAVITATPDAGYALTAWSGACTGTNPSCSVIMDSAKTASAIFTKINTAPTVKPVTVTTNIDGQATVTLDGSDAEKDTLIYATNKTVLTYGSITKISDGIYRYTLTNKTTNGVNDAFSYTASDGKLTSTKADVTIIIPKTVVADADKDTIPDSFDLCPNTPVALLSKIDKYGCPKPLISKFDIKPVIDTVSPKNIVNLVLGRRNIGQVKFNQPVDISRDNAELDVDSNILITQKRIEVRAANVPELNKPATITLYGITEKNPKILRNGVACPVTQCVINSFKDGELTFTVNGF